MRSIRLHLLPAFLLIGSTGTAQSWSDDFNRPDGSDMGPDWSEQYGDMGIAGMAGRGQLSSGNSKMVHTLAVVPDYKEAYQEITLLPPSGVSGPHVALIFGDGGARNLYTKIQDNNSSGDYDRIYFYSADNGTSWGNLSSIALTTPVTTARVRMGFSEDGDTLNVDIDADFDGVFEQHYENSGLLSIAGMLGTGVGIGTWAMGTYDDWELGGLEPSGLTGSPDQISVVAGGVQSWDLDAGNDLALLPYLILGSLSGTSPGFAIDQYTLPLNVDIYTFLTLNSPNVPPLAGSFGTLDLNGRASASFTLPSMTFPGLVGTTANHAFVVIELQPTLLQLVYVSQALPLTFVP